MALRRIFIDSQAVLLTRLASIANDGNDYEIVFAGGIYEVTGFLVVNHSAGGKIVMRPHANAEVSFRAAVGAFGFFNVIAQDILVHRIHFGDNIPYQVRTGARTCLGLFGGRNAQGGSALCHPTSLRLIECSNNGASSVTLYPSSNSGVYTDLSVNGHRIEDGGINGMITLSSSDQVNGYYNAKIDDLQGNGKNGPDSITFDPEGPLVAQGSHVAGTAFLTTIGTAGSSTITVTRARYLSQILGSNNHDMHCVQHVNMLSPDVRILYRDCILKGQWEDGHCIGDGGGNMWLGYYHGGGPTYLGARPRFDFENCTLESTIFDAVDQVPGDINDGHLVVWQCGSDADYHFWDSLIKWNVPAAYTAGTYGFTRLTDNHAVFLHNSQIVGAATPFAPSVINSSDALTLDNPGPLWGRTPTPV